MRIKLTPEADQAFEAIIADALKVNPFIEPDNSRWLSAIVTLFHRATNAKIRDELVQAVSSPESIRLALIQQIEQASRSMDAQAIRQLESSVRKLSSQTKKSEVSENE